MDQHRIAVSMGEGTVARTPHIVLSEGLGSCVAITLYDTRRKIGGLAHVMLPDSSSLVGLRPPYHCADTAITALLRGLRSRGAVRQDIVVKIIGGAQMFTCSNGSGPGIGEQNITSIRHMLRRRGIKLVGEDTGGHCGRNVEFHLDSGRVIVRAIGSEDREI